MFYETYVLKKFIIFARKHLSWRHFLISIVTKRLQHRCFSCKYFKIFKNIFFMEHLRWLLLQILLKKDVPKNFANSNRIFLYRSHFLSSCRTITCNFVKKRFQYGCFAVNFEKFLRTILCRASLNGCS